MPIYEYSCQECGNVFDKLVRSMSSVVEVECPECHSKNCKKNITRFGTASSSGGGRAAASSCAPSG